MLCPEVWNFKAPSSYFTSEKGDLNDKHHKEILKNFYYNHLVSVVLPDTLKVPESLSESLVVDCDYYKVSAVSLDKFADNNFVDSFIRKGNTSALSVGRRIDIDDCVVITPSGKLILSLTKETYQTLGVEGKVSHFCKKTRDRYIVKIDLLAKDFAPGKKNYERTKKQLQTLQPCTFIITWQPPTEEICPSSIAKYFHDMNLDVKLCQPKCNSKIEYSIDVPKIDIDNFDLDDTYDIVEWFGMVSLGGDLQTDKADDYLNTFVTPEPRETVGQVKYFEWRGFFTPQKILLLLNELRDFLNNENKQYAFIYVQGFSDSPISWGEDEHHFYTNGDNCYTVIMHQSGKYVISLNKCSNKHYK